MARRFLLFAFAFSGPPRVKDLEVPFNAAGDDWMRHSTTNWIVFTERSAHEWYKYIRPWIGDTDEVLIVGLDMNDRSGWLTKWIWDWIDMRRGIERGYTKEIADLLSKIPSNPQIPNPKI